MNIPTPGFDSVTWGGPYSLHLKQTNLKHFDDSSTSKSLDHTSRSTFLRTLYPFLKYVCSIEFFLQIIA